MSDTSQEPVIIVKNLTKEFIIPHKKSNSLKQLFVNLGRKGKVDRRKVLNDISFEIKKGDFFGIIGRNGSGKSTLLKLLAGVYTPTNGAIHVNGSLTPFIELGVGFNPELTGRENVFLNGALLGFTHKQMEEMYKDIVEFAELHDFMDQRLKNYSSGMQVRLAFSIAIRAKSDILLIDEVLAVGDTNFQQKCFDYFSDIRRSDMTVVFVSHDMASVERFCDRTLLLKDGRISKIGKTADVIYRYTKENVLGDDNRTRSDNEDIETKHAKIKQIKFLNKDNKEQSIFMPNDDISIRVYFDIKDKNREYNFGLALYNQDDDYVIGINTIFDKINVDEFIRRGYFQVDFKNLSVNSGSYYALANIVKDNFELPYALLRKSQYFHVRSKNKNEGIVYPNYRWNQ